MVKLIVGNLPPSSTNQTLKEIFYEYEDLQDYKLISNYGFVYLESDESAAHAVYNLNGIDYYGYQITVDYVGSNRKKRMLVNPTGINMYPQGAAPVQNRALQSTMENRNSNPYNLSFDCNNPDSTGAFDMASENMYGPQPPLQTRNANPYNFHIKKSNTAIDRRYGSQTFQDSMYGTMPYSNVDTPHEDQYGSYGNYCEQYIPEEEYFSNPPLLKKARADPFMDFDALDYESNKPVDFTLDEFRPFRANQPNWFDFRQSKVRSAFLHPRDEPYYRPRGRTTYGSNKSYIDEYADDQDYGDIDPYPKYLKQYQ